MSPLHFTSELIERVDRFGARFNEERMRAAAELPGNPFDIEQRNFGNGGIASKTRHPLLRGKNRIYGFGSSDLNLLEELLAFYHEDGLTPWIFVLHGQMTAELVHKFTQAGFWSTGDGAVLAIVPDFSRNDSPPSNVHVRPSEVDEKEIYLDIFQQAFQGREEQALEYRAYQWAEDTLPGCRRYFAYIDGRVVGMASFPIIDGTGFFGTAGVLPEFRSRGAQTALIRRRIADASSAGCRLVLGGGSPGTPEYRNFERAGLSLVPCGSIWRQT